MHAEDVVTLMIPATYFVMLGIERFANGRNWPEIRFWRTEGVAFFVMLIGRDANLPLYGPSNRGRVEAGSNPA